MGGTGAGRFFGLLHYKLFCFFIRPGGRFRYPEAVTDQGLFICLLDANTGAELVLADGGVVFTKIDHVAVGVGTEIVGLLFQPDTPWLGNVVKKRLVGDIAVRFMALGAGAAGLFLLFS